MKGVILCFGGINGIDVVVAAVADVAVVGIGFGS